MSDKINHPAHYGGDMPYEPIKVIEAWGLGFHLGNALKYIARWGAKGGLDDLHKAIWYINRFIEIREAEDEQLARIRTEAAIDHHFGRDYGERVSANMARNALKPQDA
jgi:hypothetical protein